MQDLPELQNLGWQEGCYEYQSQILEEESIERQARREWAIVELEKERRAQTIESYVNSVTKTTWFTGLVSAGLEELRLGKETVELTAPGDYEVVCPFFVPDAEQGFLANNLQNIWKSANSTLLLSTRAVNKTTKIL